MTWSLKRASPGGMRSRVRGLKVGGHALVLLAGEGVDLLVGVGGKQLAPVMAEGHAADVDARPAPTPPVSMLSCLRAGYKEHPSQADV